MEHFATVYNFHIRLQLEYFLPVCPRISCFGLCTINQNTKSAGKRVKSTLFQGLLWIQNVYIKHIASSLGMLHKLTSLVFVSYLVPYIYIFSFQCLCRFLKEFSVPANSQLGGMLFQLFTTLSNNNNKIKVHTDQKELPSYVVWKGVL